MNKVTSPDWPDPSEWVARLHDALDQRRKSYDQAGDPLLKRNMAGGMLAEIIRALMELPPFKSGTAHLPLKDLLIFLADLDRGRDHPWAAPLNFGGTNVTKTAQQELKIWVRAAFAVLRANDHRPVEAYRCIADGLTKSGRVGRGGSAVRWQTVQTWCRESESSREQEIRTKLQRWWQEFRAETQAINVTDGHGQRVAEKGIARLFADNIWTLDHLRDRSISPPSE